jgi:hypothetical protein
MPELPDFEYELESSRPRGQRTCDMVMQGSKGSATCNFSIAGTPYYGGEGTYSATLNATVQINEDSVSLEGVWTESAEISSGNYAYRVECQMDFSGNAIRRQGREGSGRFSMFGGLWQGNAVSSGRCSEVYGGEPFGSSNDDSWAFEADVAQDQGSVTLRSLLSGEDESWLFESSAGGLVVRPQGESAATFVPESR